MRALVYLACCQQADGGFPQNFWIDGGPYWQGIQLDEVAFPILLAWHLWKKDALRDFDPYSMVRSAAAYLVRHGPATQQERWEEESGYSPSTLAVSIAALICAADFARARGEQVAAIFLQDYADFLESHVEGWTVTTNGSLVSGIQRHYIRIHPAAIGDPCPDEDPNNGLLSIHNRPPGTPWQFSAKDIVDPGFLELVRYGIRKPGDPLIGRLIPTRRRWPADHRARRRRRRFARRHSQRRTLRERISCPSIFQAIGNVTIREHH